MQNNFKCLYRQSFDRLYFVSILSTFLSHRHILVCYPYIFIEIHTKMLSKTRTVFLAISVGCAYVVWGALISLQPPFYPTEAEKKGATPSEVYSSYQIPLLIFKYLCIVHKSTNIYITTFDIFLILYFINQYGFVFGITNLAAFIFAPIFGAYGARIGAKLLYNSGAFLQGIIGIMFAFLVYIPSTAAFIGLSYLLR